VSVYAIDWTWFEKEGQVRKGHKKLTITLLTYTFKLDEDYSIFVWGGRERNGAGTIPGRMV
jgi:hypothetical protein